MKQEMNLTHFVCNDLNAIQVMIYCTLIAAMLVLVFKKLNGIKSYKNAKTRFVKELVAAVTLELIEKPGGFERFKEMLAICQKKSPKLFLILVFLYPNPSYTPNSSFIIHNSSFPLHATYPIRSARPRETRHLDGRCSIQHCPLY